MRIFSLSVTASMPPSPCPPSAPLKGVPGAGAAACAGHGLLDENDDEEEEDEDEEEEGDREEEVCVGAVAVAWGRVCAEPRAWLLPWPPSSSAPLFLLAPAISSSPSSSSPSSS